MTFSRLARTPVPRAALAILLAGVIVTGGIAARIGSASCRGSPGQCSAGEMVRWSQPLPGSWIAENGVGGTVVSQGQAYAAASDEAAVIGFGLTVSAYDLATGTRRWSQTLTGVPAGSVIVAVRAWHGVVTAGVSPPSAAGGAGQAGAAGGAAPRQEIVLSLVTGRQIMMYPAAASGGAVRASLRRTVIVGQTSVVSYANATGKAVWRDPTGPAQQAWLVAGRSVYVTVSASGEVGTAPVTAVRQIDLRTGRERLIRPPGGPFDGQLAAVVAGVLVFSGSSGLRMYSTADGQPTGQRPGAVVEGVDPVLGILDADVRGTLTGIDPVTGQNEPGTGAAMPPGIYAVRAGVGLGLDPGAGGSAWGYSIAKRHVVWVAKPLPWPHFFAAPAGLGGDDSGSGMALLVTCGATGRAVPGAVIGAGGRLCLRPTLVAIGPWGPRS